MKELYQSVHKRHKKHKIIYKSNTYLYFLCFYVLMRAYRYLLYIFYYSFIHILFFIPSTVGGRGRAGYRVYLF